MQNIKKNQKNNYYNIEINKNQTNVASKLNQKSPNKRIREGIMYDNFIYKEQCRKRNNTGEISSDSTMDSKKYYDNKIFPISQTMNLS